MSSVVYSVSIGCGILLMSSWSTEGIMAECVNCGAYTKFNGGLCLKCYRSKDATDADSQVEDDKSVAKPQKVKSLAKEAQENPWVSGVIKGRIAETIVEELFRSLEFQVFSYGMENSIPGIMDLLKGVRGDVSKNIRQMPDFVVFKDKEAHFIEVKFRANGILKLSDIEKPQYGDYPFENALFVLVTKKHIKCISYQQLKAGKEISPKCRHYLGKRTEFETDSQKIIDYCKYAVKFFESV